MAKRKINIVQDEQKEVSQSILAQSIVDIAKAVKALNDGPLNQRAIILLLKGSLPSVSLSDIKLVLEAIADLERNYVK